MAAAHRWNWAQRELDLAARAAPEGPAAADLASVRDVRRQLRVLQKWPRDAQAHLALGRAYFELGLGADAEQALRQAIALAPAEPAGHLLLALEYAYRGELAASERSYAEALARGEGLPPLAALLADLQAAPADASGATAVPPPAAPGT
jgi:tetratricopeptide (TPR) repeat protein